jgi:hypothetical protein
VRKIDDIKDVMVRTCVTNEQKYNSSESIKNGDGE